MTGLELADLLEQRGVKIKSKTRTSIVALVDGNRLAGMEDIANMLQRFGARIDRNLKGSSIGGIVVRGVKILIKAAGSTGGLDVEAAAISALSDALSTALILSGGPVSLRVGGRTISGVVEVVKTAGTPKSDFHLADGAGCPLIHISHKKGSTPRDFQQWGGVTEQRILQHPEVQLFAEQCRNLYGGRIPAGESAFKKIKDNNLKMMSVFGVNFDKGSADVNRVDVLLQGDPGLRMVRGNLFELTATGHVNYHGGIPGGGFEPVLAMIYKGGRDQLGVKGARASIYPLGGRTFKRELNNQQLCQSLIGNYSCCH